MSKQICPKCNARVVNRDGFCRNCGNPLGPPPPASPPLLLLSAGAALVLLIVAGAAFSFLRGPNAPPGQTPSAIAMVTDTPPATRDMPSATTEAPPAPTEVASVASSTPFSLTAAPTQTLTQVPAPTQTPTEMPALTKTPAPTEMPTAPATPQVLPTLVPTPIRKLRVILLNYNDAPTCISMGIAGTNPTGWRLIVDGLNLSATFDGGTSSGNARVCGMGNGQEVTISIINESGRVVRGGAGIPAKGSAILLGEWR